MKNLKINKPNEIKPFFNQSKVTTEATATDTKVTTRATKVTKVTKATPNNSAATLTNAAKR